MCPRIGQRFNPYRLFPGVFIPEPICKYKGLSPGAKIIYGRMCRYGGQDGAVYPALKTLAEEVGLSETQARNYIRELERQRFIEVDRENRHFGKDGSGGSNDYAFLWHEAFFGEYGESRKVPPPLRKTEGVPLRITAPLTPADNRTQRESLLSRESKEESQSTSDYQPTNRTKRDSSAGYNCGATDVALRDRTPTPNTPGDTKQHSAENQAWMKDVLNDYGRRRTMRQQMREEVPPLIIQKCLDAAGDTPLRDIGEILRFKCLNRGLEPGTSKGPQGWGWFPTVIANELAARRDQQVAGGDGALRKHWTNYATEPDPDLVRRISAFSALDDLEANHEPLQ